MKETPAIRYKHNPTGASLNQISVELNILSAVLTKDCLQKPKTVVVVLDSMLRHVVL